jgi:hypothetical protein
MPLGTCPTFWIAAVLGQQCLYVFQTKVVLPQVTYAPHYVRSWSPGGDRWWVRACEGGSSV